MVSCLDAAPQKPYSLCASYKKSFMPSIRHCTWLLLIWKRHSYKGSHRACMKTSEAEYVLVATCAKGSVWKWVFPLLFEPLVFHHGSGNPLPEVSNRMSLGKHACRWPGHHHWIAGGITPKADPLEDRHGRKGISGQREQNQGPDIWAVARHASEVWQGPMLHVSQGRRHKRHFLWWLFLLDPQEMPWHPRQSKVWCQLQV